VRRAPPRPSSRSRPRSPTGAGPACPSICAPASAGHARFRDRHRVQEDPAFDLRRPCRPIYNNQLVIRLQPDEGVKQFIMIKDPGPGGMRLRQIPLDMSSHKASTGRAPDAYERLLMDVVRGNQTLFMRRDEVEAAWPGSTRSSRPGPRTGRRCSPTPPAPGVHPPRSR
jgi:hypothetical protein